MTQQEIEKLEKLLQSYKDSLTFAKQTGNKHRESVYNKRIIEAEAQLKELKKDLPIESGEELRGEIDELYDQIKDLEKTKEDLTVELKEETLKIDKLINPEKYKEPEPESVSIPEPEIEKTQCPYCERIVNGEKGLKTHLSRWCSEKPEVEVLVS